ncbi:DUF417 family protein [Pseudoalteromonas fenneropenaei]|uniref:DUF417 family protein n=1 Tax=Pseudoalteromonas fenneropenaei TaxID=1737459 RepID=A0ABV7CIN0_9GAMM
MMLQLSATRLVQVLLSMSLLLLGGSFLLGANSKALQALLDFYWLSSDWLALLRGFTAALLVFAVVLLWLPKRLLPPRLSSLPLLLIALVPLFTLFSETRWLAALGGFPAIGSGQGIIKYYALVPLLVFLCWREQLSAKQHALLNASSVALVLFWIGGMKFTTYEAEGIQALVASSPLMSWMYQLMSLQVASNVIGVYDLCFAALLLWAIYKGNRHWTLIASLGCGAVFITTQTFLFSFTGALSMGTVLSGTGQFLIKDLWFVANLAVVLWWQGSLKE